jgi:hypothetical protein
MIRAVHPGPKFLPIPDLGSRGQKGTESRILIRNTGFRSMFNMWWIRMMYALTSVLCSRIQEEKITLKKKG